MGDVMKRSGGFFIFEMIIGLGLLALAAFVLIMATSRVHLASSVMADSRAATRAAEAALSQLQAGRPMGAPDPDAPVQVGPAPAATPDDSWQWVEVTAAVRGQRRTLIGRVPRDIAQTSPTQGGTP